MSRSAPLSKEVRKPWGGQLNAPQAAPKPVDPHDLVHWVGVGSRKFAELMLLALLIAVPMVYHLSVSESLYTGLRSALMQVLMQLFGMDENASAFFFEDEISPFLTGGLSVLPTKFSTWFIGGIALIAAFMVCRFVEALSRRTFFEPTAFDRAGSRHSLHRLIPFAVGSVLLLYALGSLLFWPPKVPAEAASMLRPDGGPAPGVLGWLGGLGGGGFLYSLIAWLQVVFAFFFYFVIEDMIRARPFVNKLLGVIVLVGVVNALVVVLLKVGGTPLESIWLKFSGDEIRNNLGAFIGHNTGVSSFLMAPFFLALVWMIGVHPKKRTTFRVILGGALVLFALAIILAQSRAIVPLVMVGCVVAVWMLWRRSCIARLSRSLVWVPVALVLVVGTQFINSSYNPFYRRDITLTQRISQFRYNHLRTETRLRIFWISLSQLIPERPLFGHGWASFQYVYPEAAGRFFEQYPNTELAPTPLRTPQAHNEYLQTIVELGLLGAVLLAAALYFLLRGGMLVLQRTIIPYHMTVQIGIWISILAILAHGALDFPFRVPPIALTLTVLLAIWSASDRVWLFPLKAPKGVDDSAEADADPEATGADPEERESLPANPIPLVRNRPALFALTGFVTLVAMGAGATLTGIAAGPFQTIRTIVVQGQMSLQNYAQTQNANYLNHAYECAFAAQRIFWIDGEANQLKAYVQLHRGLALFRESRRHFGKGENELGSRTAAVAETYAKAGLSDVNMSLTEMRYNRQYSLRSTLNELLSTDGRRNDRGYHASMAMEDLYKATSMNPGDPDDLLSLIQRLEREPELNRNEILRHMRIMNYFHRDMFRSRLYGRVADAALLHQNEDVRRLMAPILETIGPGFREFTRREGAAPDYAALSIKELRRLAADDDIRLGNAGFHLVEGNAEVALDLASRYLDWYEKGLKPRLGEFSAEVRRDIDNNQRTARIILINVTLQRGEIALSDRLIKSMTKPDHYDYPLMRVLSVALEAKRTNSMRVFDQRFLSEVESNPGMATTVASVIEEIFRDRREALRWMQIRREIASTPMSASDLAKMARLAHATGEWEQLAMLMPELDKARGTPMINLLIDRLKAGYRAELLKQGIAVAP